MIFVRRGTGLPKEWRDWGEKVRSCRQFWSGKAGFSGGGGGRRYHIRFPEKLFTAQVAVRLGGCKQSGMAALRLNCSFIKQDDSVAIHNRTQTVGDDN